MSDLVEDVERVVVYVDGEELKEYVNRLDDEQVDVLIEREA